MDIIKKIVLDNYYHRAKQYKKLQKKFYTILSNDQSRKILYKFLKEIGELEGKVVLDAGCGFGNDLKFLEDFGLDVYGIDISEKMIELAKGDFPELQDKLYVGNFEETSFQDEFFDIIFSRYALEYSFDLEKTFREFHRILKTNGIVLCLVTHPLLSFIYQEDKVYGNKEIVSIPIYNGEFIVKEVSRIFSEYLSPSILANFDIVRFYENPGLENFPNNTKVKIVVPDYFILMLRKK